MGADLCGYILVGPKVLSKARIAKAKKHVLAVLARARDLGKKAKDTSFDVEAALKNDGEISEVLDGLAMGDDAESGLEQIASMDTNAIVDEAVEAWGGGYRDWMDRLVPGSTRLKIGVCGERTCGDGPQDGSAWKVMDTAARMGVLDVLGIK
jgi:hypothetical protein